jgi:hypothetical protein
MELRKPKSKSEFENLWLDQIRQGHFGQIRPPPDKRGCGPLR